MKQHSCSVHIRKPHTQIVVTNNISVIVIVSPFDVDQGPHVLFSQKGSFCWETISMSVAASEIRVQHRHYIHACRENSSGVPLLPPQNHQSLSLWLKGNSIQFLNLSVIFQ